MQARVIAMSEPDPSGALDKIALFNEDGSPFSVEIPTLVVGDVEGAAPIADPVFTGNPRSPTPAPGDNDTSIATSAFVKSALDALVSGAPGTLDTLNEIAIALTNDESVASALATTVSGKASKASNLGDLASAATARTNLGLGSVDNTPDSGKPVSTAQQTAFDLKVNETTRSASTKGFKNHGAIAGTARPTGYASIEWYGSVEPTNAVDGDTWINTA